jgi:hypothetical protein
MSEHTAQTKFRHSCGMVSAPYRAFLMNALNIKRRRDENGDFNALWSKLQWHEDNNLWKNFISGAELAELS